MSQPPWPDWPPPPPPPEEGAGAGGPAPPGWPLPPPAPPGSLAPGWWAPPPARPRGGMRVLAVFLCVALPLLGLGAVWLVLSGISSGGGPAPHATSLTLDSGRVVWSDDFANRGSGWFSGTDSAGSSFVYMGGAYVISGSGDTAHAATAPYSRGLAAMAVSASFTLASAGDIEAGAGLRCDHAGDDSTTHYVAFLFPDGGLQVFRYPGAAESPADEPTSILIGYVPGVGQVGQANRMSLACITVSVGNGSQTTRILVQVNFGTVQSVTDSYATGGDSGWNGGVESEGASTVEYDDFRIRNLEG